MRQPRRVIQVVDASTDPPTVFLMRERAKRYGVPYRVSVEGTGPSGYWSRSMYEVQRKREAIASCRRAAKYYTDPTGTVTQAGAVVYSIGET